ncbi:cupin domain-containing protein [Candidatus Woesearchaeota archaeon]|nr:cupin domain-containing protein [Candidatus Woesearchaeota archaeon]
MHTVIDLKQKIKEFGGKPYSPIDVSRINDYVVRMALFDGEYHWHKHANDDELFFVYIGEIEIQYKGRKNARVKEGQMHIVPKGTEHCPRSIKPSYVLLFEPFNVNPKGD